MNAPAIDQHTAKEFVLPLPQIVRQAQPYGGWKQTVHSYIVGIRLNTSPYASEKEGTTLETIIKQRSPALSVAEQVQQIEARLGLNRSQLAKALNVIRKTIYDWCNKGAKLSDTRTEERLQKLLQITNKQTDEAMGKYYGANLQRPVSDEKSLLDILTDEVIDVDKANTALMTVASLAAESKTRMEAFARKKPSPLPDYEAQAILEHIAPRT